MTARLTTRIRVPACALLALTSAAFLASGPPAQSRTAADRTLDERFAEVGRRVPGFAGTYVDERRRRLIILSTRPTPAVAHAARRALVEELGDASLAGLEPVALKARYSFGRLKAWHDRVTLDVLAIPGVVMTDIDDVGNRLTVGIEPGAQLTDLIEARLVALDVPRTAVTIEETEPVTFTTSLRTRHRPIVGGLMITRPDTAYCTLGFNATRSSVGGFVTNSHCTSTPGGVESTTFWQPTKLATNKIGVESADPLYFTGGSCPAGRRCRYSDSAFAKYDLAVTFDKGKVARTPVDSNAWNGTDKFRITAETTPLIGQGVAKVGRTTGRTIGTVASQCVNVSVAGTNINLLCQSKANYRSGPGDSGSPVIRSEGGAANDVSLKGINWGSDGAYGYFSMIGNIVRSDELGSISTCASGFSC